MVDRGFSYEGNPPPRGSNGVRERRVALVIGNGAYSHAAPLDNPVRDAEAMASRLAKLGFDVVKGLDLNLRQIGDVQGAFEGKLRAKPEVALLFYAGHGLQVEGRNYLVPIDAEITTKSHLATRALLFNDLLDDMAREAGATLIFLDACRDNPFTRSIATSLGDSARFAGVRGGLARIEKVAGTFIAYATAPDQVAFDGKGQNSPFTSALLAHIDTPGLSVGDLMIDVRNKVLAETNERQEPWDQSSLRARFYFVPPESEKGGVQLSQGASEWGAIQETTSLAVLAAFRDRHPDPPWSTYAEARANELRAADEARRSANVEASTTDVAPLKAPIPEINREMILAAMKRMSDLDKPASWFSRKKVWYAPSIPYATSNRAAVNIKIPATSEIFAYFDSATSDLPGTYGIVIADSGIYFSKRSGPQHVEWCDFIQHEIIVGSWAPFIFFNRSNKLQLGGMWTGKLGEAYEPAFHFLMQLRAEALKSVLPAFKRDRGA